MLDVIYIHNIIIYITSNMHYLLIKRGNLQTLQPPRREKTTRRLPPVTIFSPLFSRQLGFWSRCLTFYRSSQIICRITHDPLSYLKIRQRISMTLCIQNFNAVSILFLVVLIAFALYLIKLYIKNI